MKTLFEAISAHAGGQTQALLRHLNDSGIKDWAGLTKSNLSDFRDHLISSVATSSSRTYLAVLKGILARYEEDIDIPCKTYRDVLKMKNEKCVKTFLNPNELKALEETQPNGQTELMVKCQFLIGAYTGMRISDIKGVTPENIENGYIRYVSQKTSIEALIPCSERVARLITITASYKQDISLCGYNKAIRRLCKRAGITDKVKVFKAGKTIIGEKWEFVSSHTARISFATNLAACNVPILSISKLCGHTSVTTTQHYIVDQAVKLNDLAMEYLR